jgi:hypothetical protein
MANETVANTESLGAASPARGGRRARRAALAGLAGALALLLAGDSARTQSASDIGIDPLDILKLQVKNNVLFILDTSGSMKWPTDQDNFSVGSDDPMSRMYQAKEAVQVVVAQNADRLSFGLASYEVTNSSKFLNGNIDGRENFNGNRATGNNFDGPLIYVSVDAAAASFYTPRTCPASGTTRDGYFCQIDIDLADHDGTSSTDVYQSFYNNSVDGDGNDVNPPRFRDPYPAGCTPGVDCRYYMMSRLLRNDVLFQWDMNAATIASSLTATETIDCSAIYTANAAALNGKFSDENPNRPCFQMRNQQTGAVATFFYSSGIFANSSSTSCGGTATITNVASCDPASGALALQAIDLAMQREILLNDDGSLSGVPAANSGSTLEGVAPTLNGLRAAQSTPLAGSLNEVRTTGSPLFPARPAAVEGVQKNYVILLTDGDDTCATGNNNNERAINAAREAEALFENTANPRNQAETIVIAFADGVDVERANWIARAGSGGHVESDGTITCPVNEPDRPCRDAFVAADAEELEAVLSAALELTVGSAELATSPTTLATVFELGPLVDPTVDPDDPNTRYNARVNVLYQATVEMPDWTGHFYAYLNDGTYQRVGTDNPSGIWDAAETMSESLKAGMLEDVTGRGPNSFTFEELHDGATAKNIRTSNARIKRRVITSHPTDGSGLSAYNRNFPRTAEADYDSSSAQGTNVVSLWPPTSDGLRAQGIVIDPDEGTVGPLDEALGLTDRTSEELELDFKACLFSPTSGGAPSASCQSSDPAVLLAAQKKEVRQMILAWVAGAEARRDSEGFPIRHTDGQVLYRHRDWLLIDSTLGQPAVVSPPLRNTPNDKIKEFLLFRDGRRNASRQGINEIDEGFGLRNPDFDDADPASKADLKPLMTVVYAPFNDGLHAFRAGPNCGTVTAGIPACAENGSQELWHFVPVDQLHKLYQLATQNGQRQNPHVYVTSASPRVADVFVPGSFTRDGVTYEGRWRTLLLIGRGPGGKFYSALDVTAPGPYTRQALDTNLPWVLWNKGNEDGFVPAPNESADVGWDALGQTWSTPAIGKVTGRYIDWLAFTGSGYGASASEGSTFYVLDPVTGTILSSTTVPQGTATYVAYNALVAGPSAYNAFQLDPPNAANRSEDRVTRVYIPDVHGRVWRFDASSGIPQPAKLLDAGPTQPFGDPAGLLKLNVDGTEKPWVFLGSGNDRRVPRTTTFYGYGMPDSTAADNLLATIPLGSLPIDPTDTGNVSGFRRSFVDGSGNRYFSSAQPATAFNEAGNGRVFFVATRFVPPDISCLSRFDSLLFALGAASGGAAYDFNDDGTADLFTRIEGQRISSVQTAGGQVIYSKSGNLGTPPGPPPPPSTMPTPASPEPARISVTALRPGTPVCRF